MTRILQGLCSCAAPVSTTKDLEGEAEIRGVAERAPGMREPARRVYGCAERGEDGSVKGSGESGFVLAAMFGERVRFRLTMGCVGGFMD